MSGKVFDGDESEPATPSLAAQSQSSAQTALSEPVAPSAHEVQDIFVRLAEVLYSGETEGPLFCFEHMKRYLKDSVPGMPTSVLSNGPTYQTQVVKKPSAEFVSKRTAPGMEGHHARALCWEALVLSVLAVMQPFIIPSLDSVVCPTPVSLQIIMERCECSVQQMQARPGPHLRLAALSKPEPSVHPIPFSHTVSIMFQIALALAAAHSLNGSHKDHPQEVIMAVIHGNVQPGNILLRSSDSLPVICGWSHSMVRWRSRSGSQHVFTAAEVPDDPFHNAPELQAAEDARSALEALSDRTDVWGFALVSLFLLTGKTPYHGMRLARVAKAREHHTPPYDPLEAVATNPELRRAPGRHVLTLLLHCLADDPEERPTMRQCVHALSPLAARYLQQNAHQMHEAARKAILKLQQQVRTASAQMEQQRVAQAGQQAEAAQAGQPAEATQTGQPAEVARRAQQVPPHVAENGSVSLHDLCQDAADQQRPEGFVLNLGSRPVMAAGDVAHHPGARYRLPCGVRGGVFHLHDGDVLSIFGTLCQGLEVRRASAAVRPPRHLAMLAPLYGGGVAPGLPPPPPPRVSFFGERATVQGVAAAECGMYVSAACSTVEGCKVRGVADMIGLEVVEARGDPMVKRELRLHHCEISQCRVGVLVKGVPCMVKLEDCRVSDSREHNIWLQKVATRASMVEFTGVEATGAARSGLLVETLCDAHCVRCVFERNGHYGMQALPKGRVRYTKDCKLEHNRRGRTSGSGVFQLPSNDR